MLFRKALTYRMVVGVCVSFYTEEHLMSMFTFMQFGCEAAIAAQDIGQPKFRLINTRIKEPLYVLLGSLYMPCESEAHIKEVEGLVNTPRLKRVLLNTLAIHTDQPVPEDAGFEYVCRTHKPMQTNDALRRMSY